MSSFDPTTFLPYGAQFGSNMTAMIGKAPNAEQGFAGTGFQGRAAGASFSEQMGGAAGIAGGAMSLVGSVMGGVGKIQDGKAMKQAGMKAQGRRTQAQAGLDMAASAASMGGPIGSAIAAPLQLISALLNINGPRAKRQKRRAEMQQRSSAKRSAMMANATAAGMQVAGGVLRTGASMGPEPTVADPSIPTISFNPMTTNA